MRGVENEDIWFCLKKLAYVEILMDLIIAN